MAIDRSLDLQARRGAVSLSTMLASGLAAVLVGAATPALSQAAMGSGAAPTVPQSRVAPAPSVPVTAPQMPTVTQGTVTPPAPAALKNKAFFEKEEMKPEGLTKGATAVVIAAAKLLSPPDGALAGGPDSKAPIAFRWTPLVPRPQEPPTYRLKVWQLMQGQNASQAMQERQPVATVDVGDLTTASIPSPGCTVKACSFVWTVQALNREGKPVGQNNGTSDPSFFRVAGREAR
ncbi:hypothetical protein [Reyranella sp.]|uniref:hypothetical protein n=1 Tax=Reyranella sp. TaxID=1929291 RepID=UPI003BABE6A2